MNNRARATKIVRTWPVWKKEVALTRGSIMKNMKTLVQQKIAVDKAIEDAKLNRNKRIGENIKRLRNANRMTQEQLAQLLGCERTTVTNIELANQRASIDNIIDLSGIFDVSFDDILNH